MLRTLSLTEQHGVALGFIMKEQPEVAARATVSTPSTPRVESLKLHVNSYVGREGEPLLRWLVEVDTAITARPFEPSQNEFRSRAEFLDLQQGKHDVHAYAQRVRYLVSNIVTNPIDEATKVVTFMKRLRDGPVKTYLFREYPSTLEAAITLAMQEEFSLRQAKLHGNVPRLARLDFEEVKLPQSLLEVRLATGVVVKTKKCVVRSGCTMERYTIKPGLIACARGLIPPAIRRKICPRPGLDKTRHAEPGSAREVNGQEGQDAQDSVRDRDAASSVCRADTATGDDRRDPECLDVYGYWSPVSEDGAREPSDASVGVDFTSSYELEGFPPRPARWTYRVDLHPLGRREDEK
ncbi:unnamed protein product [Phytophthora fragariaefolia]|uniref:Unnamed protein product n=1 Tax=Phytophthora fragariaefolia TaxID=1490495 RepID=A0A9W6U0V8_9STRA|nr:unnamed protein product [Phytophthora fragariaefolia]